LSGRTGIKAIPFCEVVQYNAEPGDHGLRKHQLTLPMLPILPMLPPPQETLRW